MRLLRAELRRFHARLMLKILLGFGIAVVGMILFSVWSQARPLSAAQTAQAEQAYADELANWEEYGDQQVADCKAQEAIEQEKDPSVDFGCDNMAPQREWYFPTPPVVADSATAALQGMTFILGFIALVAGATFTAAEVSTRSLTTWLTFEPRRLRVMTSKLSAAALGAVAPVTVLIGLTVGGSFAAYALADADTAATTAQLTGVTHTSLRLLGLSVLVVLVAAALGLLLKHTAAVLGLAVGYVAVVESALTALLPRLQPWLLMPNVQAWSMGGTSYRVPQCTTTSEGTSCGDYVEHTLSMTHGGVYLAVLTVVVIGLTALVFRRRDHG